MKSKILMLASAAFLTAAMAPTQAATSVYNTEGTFNWVCPPDVTSVQVECWGGGGAGGSGRKTVSGTNTSQNGGGGGGGAYARRDAVPVTPGLTYTVTIPAAAVSGSNGTFGANVVDGGTVTFIGDGGVTVTAAGGSGARNAYATTNSTVGAIGGAGGTIAASEGDVVFAGGTGASGNTGATSVSGGGGGAAGDANNGNNGVGKIGGAGGTSGGGAGGNGRGDGNTNAGLGGDAANPGGGGGGAKNIGQSTRLGGTGGLGQIRISFPETPATKADNADDLNLTTSWVGGEVPSGLATWDNTVMGPNTTLLGADLTFEAIAILNPAGPVTINAGNTLTLNGIGTVLDLSAATADLTLNCGLALTGGSSVDVAVGRTMTVGGAVSGSAGVTKLGDGTLILSGANTYAGNSNVVAGTLQLGAANVIPDGGSAGDVVIDGTLDLNGNSETINRLTGSGVIDNTGGAAATLTVDVGAASSFGGTLQNSGSPLNLEKTGNSSFTLAAANAYSGTTTITAGTLVLGDLSALGSTSGITIEGGAGLTPAVDGITIDVPISLGSSGTTSQIDAIFGIAGTVTLNGAISGDGNLLLNQSTGGNADGKMVLGAQSTYLGTTTLDTTDSGARLDVRLGIADALPATTVLTFDGGPGSGSGRNLRLDLNGFDQTLAGLTNVTGLSARNQRVINSGASAATLTIQNSDPYSFGGSQTHLFSSITYTTRAQIQDNISLVKSGVGTFTLVDSHIYTGTTAVNEGTLGLNGASLTSAVTVAGGAAIEFTLGAPATTTGSLDLGTGTVKIVGTVDNASDYQLMTATGGITGSLTLDIGITDYQLELRNGDTELWLAYVATGGYASWASLNGAGPNLDDDHDNDGVSNGVEYFIGGPNGNTTGFTALPGVDNDAGTLSVTFTKAADYAGVYGTDFVVETSATLANPWIPATEGIGAGFVEITGNEVKYTFPAGTKNFARLKVTGP